MSGNETTYTKPEVHYLIQWGNFGKWKDDRYMIPSPLCEAYDVLGSIMKFTRLPLARLVPTNDDANLLPIYYKRRF